MRIKYLVVPYGSEKFVKYMAFTEYIKTKKEDRDGRKLFYAKKIIYIIGGEICFIEDIANIYVNNNKQCVSIRTISGSGCLCYLLS